MKHCNNIKGKVIDNLSKDKDFGHRMSITGDEYTSMKNRKYLNLNCHQSINNQAVLTNLGLKRATGSLPATKLKKLVEEHLNR